MSETVQPIHSEKLGRYVTVRECECSEAARHTVIGPKTLECDVCGRTKFGVSERFVVPETSDSD